MAHGTIWWSELCTGDVDAAKAHYRAIAGWSYDEMSMDGHSYWVAKAGERPVAGIMPLSAIEDAGEVPPHWMTYIAVDDVEAAAGAAVETGGAVLRAPFEVAGVGRIAIVREPGGAVAGIIQPAPGTAA